jgi:hypothetical protein
VLNVEVDRLNRLIRVPIAGVLELDAFQLGGFGGEPLADESVGSDELFGKPADVFGVLDGGLPAAGGRSE